MKEWYLTREGIKGAQHKGFPLSANKYVLMNDLQAELHNKAGKEVLKKADKPPASIVDCQFPEEFEVRATRESPVQEEKPTSKRRSSSKADAE